jgi:beta-mannosidase
VEVVLRDNSGAAIRRECISAARLANGGVRWEGLAVQPWWPNFEGERPLYAVSLALMGADGTPLDCATRTIGFRSIEWKPCEGAPEGADPWICVVNGRPVFLRGVNWTPVRPNYADDTPAEIRKRLELYRDIGCNVLRVWGGSMLPTEDFFSMCDELGLLVWQEFPLCSSGPENWPPEDPCAIASFQEIARSYIVRRQHHPSLLLWCGGNELQGGPDGSKRGCGVPVTSDHPFIGMLARLVAFEDPGRRFLPSSASGPRFVADRQDFGKGLHWDVHGPWDLYGKGTMEEWRDYWDHDDALFRSETGCPSASPTDILEAMRGGLSLFPISAENPLWQRSAWWIQRDKFVAAMGREPNGIDEYVAWTQDLQAEALAYAAQSARARFPRTGGMILWMGHDVFPCAANTSIVDFHARPKPAALALRKIWAKR